MDKESKKTLKQLVDLSGEYDFRIIKFKRRSDSYEGLLHFSNKENIPLFQETINREDGFAMLLDTQLNLVEVTIY